MQKGIITLYLALSFSVMANNKQDPECFLRIGRLINKTESEINSPKRFIQLLRSKKHETLRSFTTLEDLFKRLGVSRGTIFDKIEDVVTFIKDNIEIPYSKKIRFAAEELEITLREATVILFHTGVYYGPEKTDPFKNWLKYLFWLKHEITPEFLKKMKSSRYVQGQAEWIDQYGAPLKKQYLQSLVEKTNTKLDEKYVKLEGITGVDRLLVESSDRWPFGKQVVIKGVQFVLPQDMEEMQEINSILFYQLRHFFNQLLSLKSSIKIDGLEYSSDNIMLEIYEEKIGMNRQLPLNDISERFMSVIFYEDLVGREIDKFRDFYKNFLGKDFIKIYVPTSGIKRKIRQSAYYKPVDIDLEASEATLRYDFVSRLKEDYDLSDMSIEEISFKIFDLNPKQSVGNTGKRPVWILEDYIYPLFKIKTREIVKKTSYQLPLKAIVPIPQFNLVDVEFLSLLSHRTRYLFRNSKRGGLGVLENEIKGLKKYNDLTKTLRDLSHYLPNRAGMKRFELDLDKTPSYDENQIRTSEEASRKFFKLLHSLFREYNLSVGLYNYHKKEKREGGMLKLVNLEELHRYDEVYIAINQLMNNQHRIVKYTKKIHPQINFNPIKERVIREKMEKIRAKIDIILSKKDIEKFQGSVHRKNGGTYSLIDFFTKLINKGSIYHQYGVKKFFKYTIEIILSAPYRDIELREKYLAKIEQIPFGKFDGQGGTRKNLEAPIKRQIFGLMVLRELYDELAVKHESLKELSDQLPLSYNEVSEFLLMFPELKRKIYEFELEKGALSKEEVIAAERKKNLESYNKSFPKLSHEQKENFISDIGLKPILSMLMMKTFKTQSLIVHDTGDLFEKIFQRLRENFSNHQLIEEYYKKWKQVGVKKSSGRLLSGKGPSRDKAFRVVYHSLRLIIELSNQLDVNLKLTASDAHLGAVGEDLFSFLGELKHQH